MDALFLTLDQVAVAVGVDRGTVSKFMGSPKGELGAASRRALLAYYREVATAKGIPIDEPPAGFIVAGAGDSATHAASVPADLSRALVLQAETFGRMLEAALRRDQTVEVRLRALEAEVESLRERLGAEGSPGQSTRPQTEGAGQ